MNVLFASDDNYATLLGVSLYSFLENNCREFDKIEIYVLDGGISDKNKEKLQEICDEFNVGEMSFVKYDDIDKVLGIDIKATRPLSTYARLFAASLLDDSIDKILYVDVDGVVTGSFKELWETDIEDYDCAGVLDAGPKFNNIFLGIPENDEHYNAGVLLINLKKWRDEKIEEKFLDLIIENDGEVHHNDQGIINVISKGKILKVHPKYNVVSPFFEVSYWDVLKWNGIDDYYSEETLDEAVKNPVFIHLVQFVNGRPWFTNAQKHPLRKIFDEYVKKTPFEDEEVYIEDNRHLKGKFFSFAYKYLPYSLVCDMFKIYRYFLIKLN